jgi:hypothetical protein
MQEDRQLVPLTPGTGKTEWIEGKSHRGCHDIKIGIKLSRVAHACNFRTLEIEAE